MQLVRYTIIDRSGGVSFVAPFEACPAFVAACSKNPRTLDDFLELAEHLYRSIREHVLCALAVFDENTGPDNFEWIWAALDFCDPDELPAFRIVDARTREASLHPTRSGAVVFNLKAKRIIQLQNAPPGITRRGRGRLFDGARTLNRVFVYELPPEWSLVP